MPSWRNGRRAGLKHLWETVPVRVRRWVLKRAVLIRQPLLYQKMKKIPKISFREDVKKMGFEILSLAKLMGGNRPLDHNPFKAHKIDFFALLILKEGEVVHMLDFKKHKIKKNECLIISQNQVHAFDKDSKYDGYLILFTQDFLLNYFTKSAYFKIVNLFNYHIFKPKYQLNIDLQSDTEILNETYHSRLIEFKADIVSSLFAVVLLKINSQNINQINNVSSDGFELFEKYKTLVEEDYKNTRNVKDYALKLHVSYKHLNEISKKFTLNTAKGFLDDYIILEAKRKLCSTSLSIKQIAFEIGFDEPTNFLKYFKNIVGKTPLEFRSNY